MKVMSVRVATRRFGATAAASTYRIPTLFGARDRRIETDFESFSDGLTNKLSAREPVKVAVTGAAGAIGYSLLFRIANGELLGPDQPIEIAGLELPGALGALKGVGMELQDCAFPLLRGFTETSDADVAFANADIALLVGSKPRGPGMERADLVRDNGKIFQALGKSLNKVASKDVRVTVVGNPCNTNAYIAAANAPDIPKGNFTAMTRLDHDRAVGFLSQKTTLPANEIQNFCIWGNHSPTMHPDLMHTTIHGVPVAELLGYFRAERWWLNEFAPKVQQRGARIIEARKSSSAASAANACIAHTRDWCLGTALPEWTSMAYASDGQYGVPEGLVFSFPTICQNGTYRTAVYPEMMDELLPYAIEQNVLELLAERDMVADLC